MRITLHEDEINEAITIYMLIQGYKINYCKLKRVSDGFFGAVNLCTVNVEEATDKYTPIKETTLNKLTEGYKELNKIKRINQVKQNLHKWKRDNMNKEENKNE